MLGQKLIRLEAEVFAWNEPSGKVLIKNGFTLEARCKKSYLKDGELVDGLLYVIIRDD